MKTQRSNFKSFSATVFFPPHSFSAASQFYDSKNNKHQKKEKEQIQGLTLDKQREWRPKQRALSQRTKRRPWLYGQQFKKSTKKTEIRNLLMFRECVVTQKENKTKRHRDIRSKTRNDVVRYLKTERERLTFFFFVFFAFAG